MSFGLSLIPAMQKEHLSGRFVFLDLALSQNLSCVKPQDTFLELLLMSRIIKKKKKGRIE